MLLLLQWLRLLLLQWLWLLLLWLSPMLRLRHLSPVLRRQLLPLRWLRLLLQGLQWMPWLMFLPQQRQCGTDRTQQLLNRRHESLMLQIQEFQLTMHTMLTHGNCLVELILDVLMPLLQGLCALQLQPQCPSELMLEICVLLLVLLQLLLKFLLLIQDQLLPLQQRQLLIQHQPLLLEQLLRNDNVEQVSRHRGSRLAAGPPGSRQAKIT